MIRTISKVGVKEHVKTLLTGHWRQEVDGLTEYIITLLEDQEKITTERVLDSFFKNRDMIVAETLMQLRDGEITWSRAREALDLHIKKIKEGEV